MDLGLRGKVALVGGASRGLGFACARELAAEGAAVSLCSRTAGEAEAAAARIAADTGAQTAGFGFDLSEVSSPAAWTKASLDRFGRVDIVVHNTGGPPPGHFDDLDDAAWEKGFHLLVMSAVRLFRAVVPEMRRRKWGRIVAIESISVKEPIDGLLLSNALRPGVVAVAKALARDLASEGILVNCVAPGSFNTERARELVEARARRAGRAAAELLAETVQTMPRRQPGEPEELAAVVAFLCSERAANVNGATILVDGGASRSLT